MKIKMDDEVITLVLSSDVIRYYSELHRAPSSNTERWMETTSCYYHCCHSEQNIRSNNYCCKFMIMYFSSPSSTNFIVVVVLKNIRSSSSHLPSSRRKPTWASQPAARTTHTPPLPFLLVTDKMERRRTSVHKAIHAAPLPPPSSRLRTQRKLHHLSIVGDQRIGMTAIKLKKNTKKGCSFSFPLTAATLI